jgi:hypothetical protein
MRISGEKMELLGMEGSLGEGGQWHSGYHGHHKGEVLK